MRKGNVNNKSDELNYDVESKTKIVEDIRTEDEKEKIKTTLKNYNKDKIKTIILIIFLILALGITSGLLINKYVKVRKEIVTGTDITYDPTQSGIKNSTEDKKYLVSFTDMYTVNPLTVTEKTYEKKATKKQGNIYISYVEISGLKNQDLEEKINKEIKENAFYYSDKVTAKQEYHSYTSVQGNFNNILSINTSVYVYEGEETIIDKSLGLNYNLVTGEQIKFLDLFASNTPMNSIIYDLEYERLAWDTDYNLDMSEKEWENAMNMDKRDTSEYEDIILKVINRYKKLDKDKISFYITPNRINVNLAVGENGEERVYSIKQYKYIDYIILYKKFLTDDIVFNNLPSDKILVFNDMIGYVPEYYKIESDNLFISIFSYLNEEYMKEEEQAEIEKYSQSAVNKKKELMEQHTQNIITEVKKLAKSNKNKGYLARFMPYYYIDDYDNDYGSETLIYISLDGAIEEMDIDYYKENAFKLLAKQNASPKVSVDEILIGNVGYDDKNVKSLLYNEDTENVVDLSGYYTLDGTLVAKTYEEVEEYLNNKYTKPETEVEIEIEESQEEQKEVEIYKEEEQ